MPGRGAVAMSVTDVRTVQVFRQDVHWILEVPELRAVGQARTLTSAGPTAPGVGGLWLDVAAELVQVVMDYSRVDPQPWSWRLVRALSRRSSARVPLERCAVCHVHHAHDAKSSGAGGKCAAPVKVAARSVANSASGQPISPVLVVVRRAIGPVQCHVRRSPRPIAVRHARIAGRFSRGRLSVSRARGAAGSRT